MNYIKAKKQRNMQPGFFHGDMLVLVRGARAIQVEERTDFSPRNHVQIVCVSGARAGGRAGGVLRQLPDFFIEGHLLKQDFDALFYARIRQGRPGESSGMAGRCGRLRADGLSCAKTYKGKEKPRDAGRFATPLT